MSASASSAPPSSFSAYSGIGSSSPSSAGHSGRSPPRMSFESDSLRWTTLGSDDATGSGSSHSGSAKSHVSFSARNRPSALEVCPGAPLDAGPPFSARTSASAGSNAVVTAPGAVCTSVGAHCESVSRSAKTFDRNSAEPGNDPALPSAFATYSAHASRNASSHSLGRSATDPSRWTSAGKSASGDPECPGVPGLDGSDTAVPTLASPPPWWMSALVPDSLLPGRPPATRRSISRRMASWSLGTAATTVATSASRHRRRYWSLSFWRRSTNGKSRVPHAARSHRLCRRNRDARVRSALPRSTALPRSRRVTRVGSRLLLSSAASAARALAPRSAKPRLSRLRLACCTLGDVSRKPLTRILMPYLSSTRLSTAGECLAALDRVDAAVPRSCSDLAPDMIATSEPTVSCDENLCAQSPPCDAMFSIVFTA
mmetsp:Transcript_13422/g.52566  ORF Transcript_13422/g.52566 Transcript_13422/m.52566 type:complete len:428 (-) Transcript_13422:3021-4304(-)